MKSIYLAGLMIFILIFAISLEALALKPEELSPPRISSPLYQGAEVVEVWGFTPKAEIKIYENGKEIGNERCWFSKCTFAVPKITYDRVITATQTVDGITSFETRKEHEVIVKKIPDQFLDPKYHKERLIPPVIDSPLYACQRIVSVKDVIQGALVQVYSLPDQNNPIGKDMTPWDYACPVTDELTEKQKIVANQTLLFPEPSDLSPDVSVQAKPTINDILRPEVNEASLVVGSDAVEVSNLFIGATVEIYYEEGNTRETIGKNLAKWPSAIFQVKPLKAAWGNCPNCIKANQSLCEMTVTGSGKPVKDSLGPLIIKKPLCAGSIEFTVCGTAFNSTLTVFRKGNPDDEQIGQQGADDECTTVTLGGNEILNNADEIYVTQTVENLKSESESVKVVDISDPIFEIQNGKYCEPCLNEDFGPIFDRHLLTTTKGPVLKAAMCGAEAAKVDIRAPGGALIETITLEEFKGKKGYFEKSWDWNKIGWKTSQDIPPGKYKATFEIWPTAPGTKVEKYFYIATQGCVELEVLCAHNKYRAAVGVDSVAWDENLAACAQKWVDYLIKTNPERHHTDIVKNVFSTVLADCKICGDPGENWSSAGGYPWTDVVDHWGSEKKCFQNKAMPDIYNGKCDEDIDCIEAGLNWGCAGHYSQIIWKDNKTVGCAKGKNNAFCFYCPGGNVRGQKAY